MKPDPRNLALSDADMLALGRHYFMSADRDGATAGDFAALRDFVPALLHRLAEKVEVTNKLVSIPMIDLRQPGGYERMAVVAADEGGEQP